jgi:FtsP/CotA-like multicopper oxidase with cupredoxin domain
VEIRYDQPGLVTLESLLPTQNAQGELEWVPFNAFEVQVEETGDAVRDVTFVPGDAVPIRLTNVDAQLEFDAVNGPNGLEWQINGETMPEDPLFTFQEGDTVRFTLVNRQGPEHPFHLHGQFMTISPDGRPETEQPGLKDTVLVPGRSTVEVTAFMDNPGRWMAHCHILEHAELGMMAEFMVEPAD